MATYGEFSSLLQLGVGLGIGLSLFRAPVDVRIGRLSHMFENQRGALRGIQSEFATKKRRDIAELKIQFTHARGRLEAIMFPFMVAAILGAVANVSFLAIASFNSNEQISVIYQYILLTISTIYYLLIVLALELVARRALGSISAKLDEIIARSFI